jgi:hypothetical protein
MHRKTYQVGGVVLLGAGLIGIVGGILHAPQPATLEAYAELDLGRWRASHVAIALAGVLFAISALAFARHFAGAAAEAWALVGAASLLLGGIALAAIGTLETTGFSALLTAREAAGAVAAEHAFAAVSAVMFSAGSLGGFVFPVAVLAFGLAMLGDTAWPRWLAWAGRLTGVAALVYLLLRPLIKIVLLQQQFELFQSTAEIAGPVFFPGGVELVANFQKVHFPFDSSSLDAPSKAALSANAQIMQKHTTIGAELLRDIWGYRSTCSGSGPVCPARSRGWAYRRSSWVWKWRPTCS